jgi:hypothetical protein
MKLRASEQALKYSRIEGNFPASVSFKKNVFMSRQRGALRFLFAFFFLFFFYSLLFCLLSLFLPALWHFLGRFFDRFPPFMSLFLLYIH